MDSVSFYVLSWMSTLTRTSSERIENKAATPLPIGVRVRVCVCFRNVKCVLLPWNFIVRFLSIPSDFRYLIWRERKRDSQYTKTHAMEFASLNRSPSRHSTPKIHSRCWGSLHSLLLIWMVFFRKRVTTCRQNRKSTLEWNRWKCFLFIVANHLFW